MKSMTNQKNKENFCKSLIERAKKNLSESFKISENQKKKGGKLHVSSLAVSL